MIKILFFREFTFRITFRLPQISLLYGTAETLQPKYAPTFYGQMIMRRSIQLQSNQKIASILVKSTLTGLSRFTGESLFFR